jgi:hypothetical protein
MEERMFDAEYGTQQDSLEFQDIQYVLKEHSKKEAGILILGEVSQTSHLLSSPPLLPARKWKETQMFHFKKASNEGPWPGKFLGTFTSTTCTASGSVSAERKSSKAPSDRSQEASLRTFDATTEEAAMSGTQSSQRTASESRNVEEMEDIYDALKS